MNSDNTFHAALENLCGGTWFSLVGDEDIYENIKHWYVGNGNLTDSSKIPTKEEVEAEVERIKKDDVEVSRTFHRYSLPPGNVDHNGNWTDTDISGAPDEVKAICAAVWTDAVKAAYKEATKNVPLNRDPSLT